MNTLHLVVTTLCDRNCAWCCNRQYDIKNLEYVTEADLRWADMLCLTGGEPFEYTNPCNLAHYYKNKYPNIESVAVYTNAFELYKYLITYGYDSFDAIDGLNISIKDGRDAGFFNSDIFLNVAINRLPMNRVYNFTDIELKKNDNFEYIQREWQQHFVPAPNCRFKRGN